MHPVLFLENHYFPAHVTYTWFIMLVLFGLAYLATKRLELYPGRLQHVLEVFVGGVRKGMIETMGVEGTPYLPLIASLGIFILVANLLGIIPGFESPTSNLNTTASMAITVFFMTHIVGVKLHGVKYLKHFLGGVWWLAPLMIPIEIVGHLARPLSLSIRLFGNIMGEDLVLAILLLLVPFLVPLPLYILMIFTSVIQTLVFVILSMIYITLAMEEAH